VAGKRFGDLVEAVRTALGDRSAAASRALLLKTARGSNGHLIGLVADALDEHDAELLRALPEAFVRLLEDPVKHDPGCRGKAAIARALDRTEQRDHEVFERGVRHVQLEPVWGGRVDTAAELRGQCGMAMVHARAERAMVEVALLLADPEVRARIAAARALAASGDRTVAEPLLRLRIALGDPEPEALGECFAALLELVGADAIADVARYLRHEDAPTAEAAALALGSSRVSGAFAALRDADASLVGGSSRRVRLLAIALVREPEAWAYLLDLVEQGARPAAEDAVRALATFRHDDELMTSTRAAAERRGDAAVMQLLEELLDEAG
jgi:HEAT repeat protein